MFSDPAIGQHRQVGVAVEMLILDFFRGDPRKQKELTSLDFRKQRRASFCPLLALSIGYLIRLVSREERQDVDRAPAHDNWFDERFDLSIRSATKFCSPYKKSTG
jgi:hypothetical protein